MDFKKRKESSRPGRARNGEGRNSGRDYKSRSTDDNRGSRDDKPFRKRKSFGEGDNTRSEKFDRKEGRPDRFEKRPFSKDFRNDRDDKKAFGSDKRPFRREKRDDTKFSGEKKPFRRSRNEQQLSSDKPFRKERDGQRRFKPDDKPFRKERSYNSQDKPFGKERDDRRRFNSEDKPFRKERDQRSFNSDRKPYRKGRDDRNSGYKRSYSSDNESFERRPTSGRGFKENRFEGKREFRRGKNQNVSVSPETADGKIRLNRFIAASGICSRREADDLIKAGLVTVNGKVISEMGVKVSPQEDEVKYNGELVKSEKLVYILLNKPKDYVTTSKDPYAKQTVLDLLKDAGPERVFPVGRLDRNTTGVLLLTNDGDLTKKLTHPSFNKKKIYQVTLDKNLKTEHFTAISEGIELEDGFIKVDAIEYVSTEEKDLIGVEIHSGKNHIVRRIFEHFGYQVSKLDRVYFAGLTKKNLKRGEWRYLTIQEIGKLKMGSFE